MKPNHRVHRRSLRYVRAVLAYSVTACILTVTAQAQSGSWDPDGPTGGSVLSISAVEGGTVFACAYPYALCRSDDTGRTWNVVAFDGSWAGPELIAPLKSGTHLVDYRNSVLRSSDHGVSWDEVASGDITAIMEVSPGIVLAGIYDGGFLRSSDDGQTWDTANVGLVDMNVQVLATDSAGVIYAGTNSNPAALYWSEDHGLTWDTTATPPPIGYLSCVTVTKTGALLVGSWFARIARSSDGGMTWEEVFGEPDTTEPALRAFVSCDNGYVLAATRRGTLRSTDDGRSWHFVPSVLQNLSLTGILQTAGEILIASSWNMGFFRSTDYGTTWEPSNGGYRKYFTMELAATSTGISLAATDMGLHRSTDGGDSWNTVEGFFPGTVQSIAEGRRRAIYLTTEDGNILKSTNGGTVWSAMFHSYWYSLGPICLGPDSSMYVSFNDECLRSSDDGMTWEPFGSIPPTVLAMTSGGGWLYAATEAGVFRTQPPDTQWTTCLSGDPRSLDVSVSPGGDVFAATDIGLFRSTDQGLTWGFVEGLPASSFNSIVTATRSNLYVSSVKTGVYESYSAAAIWQSINAGLGVARVAHLAVTSNGMLLGGTWESGLFRYSGNALDVKPGVGKIPEHFRLSQNYPNPFNPMTVIGYDVPATGSLHTEFSLVVYDLLGRAVATLVNEPKPPGSYEVTFDASRLPSGVYLCRLTAGPITETKKMILIK